MRSSAMKHEDVIFILKAHSAIFFSIQPSFIFKKTIQVISLKKHAAKKTNQNCCHLKEFETVNLEI